MAKLDEIATLLVEELDNFKKTGETLEKRIQEFDPDRFNSKLYRLASEHEDIKKELVALANSLRRTYWKDENILKFKKKYLKWIVWPVLMVFSISVLLSVITVDQLSKTHQKQKEAYHRGGMDMVKEFEPFFSSHPEVYSKYEEWRKASESETSSKK